MNNIRIFITYFIIFLINYIQLLLLFLLIRKSNLSSDTFSYFINYTLSNFIILMFLLTIVEITLIRVIRMKVSLLINYFGFVLLGLFFIMEFLKYIIDLTK